VEISLPVSDTRPNTIKGFGFVQFSKREEAVKAVEEGNGMKLNGRVIVVDLALPKFQFDVLMETAKKENLAQDKVTDDEEEEKEEKSEGEDNGDDKAGEAEDEEDNVEDDDEEEDEEEEEEEEEGEEEEQESSEEMEVDLSDNEDEDEDEDDEEDHKKKFPKKETHDTVEGRTIFLRNLLFETTEDELAEWSVFLSSPFPFLLSF
jgi:nucleolar protein 4